METLQRNLCAKAKDLRSGLWSKSAKLGPPEQLARLLRAILRPAIGEVFISEAPIGPRSFSRPFLLE